MELGNNTTAPGRSWDSALGLLNAAQHTQIPPVVAGFDGFVDTILHVVSERHSPAEYTRLLTLQEFAQRVLAASGGRNMNIEMVTRLTKIGGNGPILSYALAHFGIQASYIGSLGWPKLHPVFDDFAKRVKTYSIGEPGYSDAIEFIDGKLVCGKQQSVSDISWQSILNALSLDELSTLVKQAGLIAFLNWGIVFSMTEIMNEFLHHIGDHLAGPRKPLFIDTTDPAKRSEADILGLVEILPRLAHKFEVYLGFNLRESTFIARALGLAEPAANSPLDVLAYSRELRERLRIDGVVIHWSRYAAGTDANSGACAEILLFAALFGAGVVRGQTITFGGDADQGEGGRWMRSRVEQFSKETGIKVNYIARPLDASQTLALWQQNWAAQTPDIDAYIIDVIWPGIAAAHATDLKEYFTEKELSEFFPRIVANNTVNGKLVAIPFFTDAGLLYYRTDLLEKYGFKNPPNTWKELQQMAQTIQEGERKAGSADFWGFLWQGAPYEGLTCNGLEWLASNGAETIVEPDGKVSINNPQTKAALTMAKGWLGTISPKGVTTYQEEEGRNAFQGGRAAFLRNWPYVYALANSDASPVKGRFDVTYLPQGDGPNASHAACLGGWQLMLSAYSKNKDAAAKLIKYMVSSETQKEHAIKLSRLPTLQALYEDKDVLAAQPWFARLLPVFQNAVARPSTVTGANYNKVSTTFFQTTNKILNGQVSVDEGVESIESKIKRDLR